MQRMENHQKNLQSETVLAFDTSCQQGSVALLYKGGSVQHTLAAGTHAALLVPTIRDVLNNAGLSMHDVDTIVTTNGPGSFTGIRISLVAAQGFALARSVRVKCTTTLAAFALRFFADCSAHSACEIWMHAGKGEAYSQRFCASDGLPRALSEITLRPLDALKESAEHTTGNVEGVHHFLAHPSAADLCACAHVLPEVDIHQTAPLYIRAPDAKPPAPFPWLASA